MKKYLLLFVSALAGIICYAQNVGIGTTTPNGKLNIKGSADTSQLVIDANSFQSNTQPLIRLRDASGADIMHIHSDGPYNTFVGLGAGRANSVLSGGLYNTFIGSSTGYANTVGSQNTAVGRGSLFYNTTGLENSCFGFKSLFSNTNGYENVAVGNQSMQSNSLGNFCVAVGYQSLFLNTLGFDNVAIGNKSLASNTTGYYNTALGSYALYLQSYSNGGAKYPNYNTALGAYALYNTNPTLTLNGIENTGEGFGALYSNTIGYYNTANGFEALYANVSGNFNTATGNSALVNTTGSYNAAFGYKSLMTNTGGSANTAVGWQADVDLNNSLNNTAIGALAHIQGNNDVVVGYGAFTNVNNLALLGSSTTTQCGGYANWSNFSDGRFKTGVAEDVKGLDFIMRLRPVTYHMNVRALYNLWGISPYGKNDSVMTAAQKTTIDRDIKNKESIHMSGFIAQEVEAAANETGYDFDGIIKPAHNKDHYRLAYGEFVVPLVKAVQEQQKLIEGQKETINKQQIIIDQILARLAALESK